jgi:hypothetical protein
VVAAAAAVASVVAAVAAAAAVAVVVAAAVMAAAAVVAVAVATAAIGEHCRDEVGGVTDSCGRRLLTVTEIRLRGRAPLSFNARRCFAFKNA